VRGMLRLTLDEPIGVERHVLVVAGILDHRSQTMLSREIDRLLDILNAPDVGN
jgi:hypothetical protein